MEEKWVKTDEKFPLNRSRVIVLTRGSEFEEEGIMRLRRFYSNKKELFSEKYSYWMPFPEPPEGLNSIKFENKPLFVMMVGLPGSGKSYHARKISEETGAILFSSDNIRDELYGSEKHQGHNKEVFAELHRRLTKSIRDGKSVIYDATNLTPSARKQTLERMKRAGCEAVCVFVDTPAEECIARNKKRSRKVPERVIRRMQEKLVPPDKEKEGWDRVEIIRE